MCIVLVALLAQVVADLLVVGLDGHRDQQIHRLDHQSVDLEHDDQLVDDRSGGLLAADHRIILMSTFFRFLIGKSTCSASWLLLHLAVE